jgi:hypothetical protein
VAQCQAGDQAAGACHQKATHETDGDEESQVLAGLQASADYCQVLDVVPCSGLGVDDGHRAVCVVEQAT